MLVQIDVPINQLGATILGLRTRNCASRAKHWNTTLPDPMLKAFSGHLLFIGFARITPSRCRPCTSLMTTQCGAHRRDGDCQIPGKFGMASRLHANLWPCRWDGTGSRNKGFNERVQAVEKATFKASSPKQSKMSYVTHDLKSHHFRN